MQLIQSNTPVTSTITVSTSTNPHQIPSSKFCFSVFLQSAEGSGPVPETAGPDAVVPSRPYHWTDLRIGMTIGVAALSITIIDADSFTRKFYQGKRGLRIFYEYVNESNSICAMFFHPNLSHIRYYSSTPSPLPSTLSSTLNPLTSPLPSTLSPPPSTPSPLH